MPWWFSLLLMWGLQKLLEWLLDRLTRGPHSVTSAEKERLEAALWRMSEARAACARLGCDPDGVPGPEDR
jgi:hypothetical protein